MSSSFPSARGQAEKIPGPCDSTGRAVEGAGGKDGAAKAVGRADVSTEEGAEKNLRFYLWICWSGR